MTDDNQQNQSNHQYQRQSNPDGSFARPTSQEILVRCIDALARPFGYAIALTVMLLTLHLLGIEKAAGKLFGQEFEVGISRSQLISLTNLESRVNALEGQLSENSQPGTSKLIASDKTEEPSEFVDDAIKELTDRGKNALSAGYIFLGNSPATSSDGLWSGQTVILNEGSLPPPKSIEIGSTLTVTAPRGLNVRQKDPTTLDNYFLGTKIVDVAPKGTEYRIIGVPQSKETSSGKTQWWVKVAPV